MNFQQFSAIVNEMKTKLSRILELNTYNTGCIDSSTNNFQADLVFSRNDNIFFLRAIARWIAGWTELHVSRDGLQRRGGRRKRGSKNGKVFHCQ